MTIDLTVCQLTTASRPTFILVPGTQPKPNPAWPRQLALGTRPHHFRLLRCSKDFRSLSSAWEWGRSGGDEDDGEGGEREEGDDDGAEPTWVRWVFDPARQLRLRAYKLAAVESIFLFCTNL